MSQDTPPTEEVLLLPFDSVDCDDRLRATDNKKVEEIAASMREREARTPGQGQIAPIKVRRMEGGRYRVVAGAHRLEAAKFAGLDYVKATLFVGDEDDARLEEIDENLFRHELTAFDQANFLEERRHIWERKHGPVKRGRDKRMNLQVEGLSQAIETQGRGFFQSTADKFGLSKSTVERALRRKARIQPRLWVALEGTEAAKNGSLLDRIADLSKDDQIDVIELVKARGCGVREAVRIVLASRSSKSAAPAPDAVVAKFRRYWKTLTADDRRAISDFIASETQNSKSGR